MKNFWKNIKSIVFYVVVFVLVGYILINIIIPDKSIKIFGFKPFVVITQSMEPVLNVNDLIIDKKPDIDNLKVGDIITFKAVVNYGEEPITITHYIYSIAEDDDGTLYFRTHRYFENEADYIPDNWFLTSDDILGQYVFHIPKVGAVIEFIKSPFGIGVIVFNAGIIGLIIYLINKDKKVDDNTKTE